MARIIVDEGIRGRGGTTVRMPSMVCDLKDDVMAICINGIFRATGKLLLRMYMYYKKRKKRAYYDSPAQDWD